MGIRIGAVGATVGAGCHRAHQYRSDVVLLACLLLSFPPSDLGMEQASSLVPAVRGCLSYGDRLFMFALPSFPQTFAKDCVVLRSWL